jgi:hypothetical protein
LLCVNACGIRQLRGCLKVSRHFAGNQRGSVKLESYAWAFGPPIGMKIVSSAQV